MRVTPFSDHQSRFHAGRFGVALFLVSLGALFIASLVGFLVIRLQTPHWPTDLPPLPTGLWLSTVILIVSSVTMQAALNAARAGRGDLLPLMMAGTSALGAAFLVNQFACWFAWLEPIADQWSRTSETRLALTSFYLFTGLHALHVIGGLIPMIIVTRNAFRGDYTAQRHAGVHYCAMYWHFLGVVWLVLFAMLMLGT